MAYIAGNIPCGSMTDPLANAPAMLGLGCTDCGGGCGMGLFEAGLDWSQWTWQEWAALLGGAYVLSSIFFTTQTAARKIRALPGERRKKQAKYYRARAAELSKKK